MLSEVLIILVLASMTCALLGVFLVLRGLTMTADAMSHTVLLGIVLAFFIVHDLSSPLLVVAAAAIGVGTVWAIELIMKTKLVKSDASIGLVFPLLFALAVLLISKYARNAHLDVDIVLMGEVLFAPLRRIDVFGYSLPLSLVSLSVMFVANVCFVALFYKELKLGSFDPVFAAVAGFGSSLLYYALMTLVSFTAVVSFDTVGSVLVVAFFACPAAVGFLLTTRLSHMIAAALLSAIAMSVSSYYLALSLDVSMSGMASVIGGALVVIAALCGPRGVVAFVLNRKRLRQELYQRSLLIHVGNHEFGSSASIELDTKLLCEHLGWSSRKVQRVVHALIAQGLLERSISTQLISLTQAGQARYFEYSGSERISISDHRADSDQIANHLAHTNS